VKPTRKRTAEQRKSQRDIKNAVRVTNTQDTSKISLSDLYGEKGGEVLPAPTGTEPTKTPVDISHLYGEHGGLVVPPPDAKPEQPKDDTD